MNQLRELISYGHIENKRMHPHKNPGMEIVLIEQGNLEWAVEGVPEKLVPGTLFFTLPWQAHGSMHVREPRNRLYFALFELEGASMEHPTQARIPRALGISEDEQQKLMATFSSTTRHAWPATELLKWSIPEMTRRFDQNNERDGRVGVSLLRGIIEELACVIESNPRAETRLGPTAEKVERFLTALATRLEHPWSLEQMAARCGVKRTHFTNITKQLTGYSPMHYLSRLRFERACLLLHERALSITDICFMCGYGSSQYFSEAFKKMARLTPSAYRESLENLDDVMRDNWMHPEARTVEDEQSRRRLMD